MKARQSVTNHLTAPCRVYLDAAEAMITRLNADQGSTQSARTMRVNAGVLAISKIMEEMAVTIDGKAPVEAVGQAFGSVMAQLPVSVRVGMIAHFGVEVRAAGEAVDRDLAEIDAAKAGAAGNA